jgi:hypothetical protein
LRESAANLRQADLFAMSEINQVFGQLEPGNAWHRVVLDADF